MILQYRTVCPLCQARIPRSGMLQTVVRCPGCNASLRQNPAWSLRGAIASGVVFFLLLGLGAVAGFRLAGPIAAIVGGALGAAAGMALAWWAFPYISKYDPPAGPG